MHMALERRRGQPSALYDNLNIDITVVVSERTYIEKVIFLCGFFFYIYGALWLPQHYFRGALGLYRYIEI